MKLTLIIVHEVCFCVSFCAAAPLSEFSMFFSGVRQCYGVPASEEYVAARKSEYESQVRKLLSRPMSPITAEIAALAAEELEACGPDVAQFYRTEVAINFEQSVKICLETHEQSESSLWFYVRSLRISGSKCYGFHTYFSNKKPDWDGKFQYEYLKHFSGDEDTLYGLQSEGPSRDLFKEKNSCSLLETGNVIRPELPYLSYSPDGVAVNEQGDFVCLFETKAPKEGKRLTADELVDNNLVKALDSTGNLKVKNKWYGQVQLGMFLFGLQSSKLVIYSSFTDKSHKPSIRAIHVPFNEGMCLEMCKRLTMVYFRELLPRMYQNWLNNNDIE